VVVAATTGALVAIGHRLGSIALPFAAVAGPVLGRTATSSDPSLVMAGAILHVLIILIWTALFVLLVDERRWRPVAAAVTIAALAHAASWVIAWATGKGLASVLPLGDRIVLAIVFAASLLVGIRFAFSPNRVR
jgi:hypothetical protein